MSGNVGEPGRSVASKVISILSSFGVTERQSLSEVARAVGLPVSSTHRILIELVERRLLVREDNRDFRIGLPLQTIGMCQGEAARIEDYAAPVLEDLAGVSGCRIRLGVVVGQDVVYMEKRPDRSPVGGFAPDATLSAWPSALGRAVLAYRPATGGTAPVALLDRAASQRPHPTPRQSLANIRSRQLAINPGDHHGGHCCFAKPVFGAEGEVVAALGITVANPDATLQALIGILSIAARSLSRQLGSSQRPVHLDLTGPPQRISG